VGCLVVLLALLSPRVAIIAIWLFSNLLDRAYESWLVPFIGFFLLPWTTLAYAVMYSSENRVYGFEWFIVGLAFIFDLSAYTQTGRLSRR
jgi:hypothetical protein